MGDANFDGKVNFNDLLVLAQHYGQPGSWVDGDFNADGAVGFDDLLLLAQNYGHTLTAAGADASSPVPEPASLVYCISLPHKSSTSAEMIDSPRLSLPAIVVR